MSAFALFTYLALCLPRKAGTALIVLLLAVEVGISRIYLVQHFLKDIFLGAILGVLVGALFYYWQMRLSSERFPWLDRSLLRRRGGKGSSLPVAQAERET